jgi:hypothetical protein
MQVIKYPSKSDYGQLLKRPLAGLYRNKGNRARHSRQCENEWRLGC